MELQYGNIKIHLSDNLSYKWTIGDSGCIRGYAYVGEEFLEGETLLRYLVSASSQEDAIQKICSLNGFYNLILQMPFGVLACVDQVRSMPLFYRGNKLFDTLDEKAVSNWALDENALAKKPFRFKPGTICYLMPQGPISTPILNWNTQRSRSRISMKRYAF